MYGSDCEPDPETTPFAGVKSAFDLIKMGKCNERSEDAALASKGGKEKAKAGRTKGRKTLDSLAILTIEFRRARRGNSSNLVLA